MLKLIGLTVLEDAYISSRYFVKEFTKEDAEECIQGGD